MTAYELMIKTNHYIIKGGELTEKHKENIVKQFLLAQNDKNTKERFYIGVNYPNNKDGMYPAFYIPPYNNGKKYKTIFNQTPLTHILSANMYELEIIRLLYVLAPNNPIVIDIVEQTVERLKTTCYGFNGCYKGECFDTVLIALRFLTNVRSNDTVWITRLINFFYDHYFDKKRSWHIMHYFWLCLSEIPLLIAEPEIRKNQNDILQHLERSRVINLDEQKILQPIILCMLRNTISRLHEYEYLKNRHPEINKTNGRLSFNIIK